MIEENKKVNNIFSPSRKEEMKKEVTELKMGLQELTISYSYLVGELEKEKKTTLYRVNKFY